MGIELPTGERRWISINAVPLANPDTGEIEHAVVTMNDITAQHEAELTIAAHSAAIALGQAGYIDPVTGLFAITAETHVKRGTCCNRGCRHCPFLGADVHAGEEA
jgi:hypothetical protein